MMFDKVGVVAEQTDQIPAVQDEKGFLTVAEVRAVLGGLGDFKLSEAATSHID